MTENVTDGVDPHAVLRRHQSGHTSFCVECGVSSITGQLVAWPCETYRLAGQLVKTRAEAEKAMLDALRDARGLITQHLSTAERWRYDRVCWAFAIMLGEIPEDSPEPMYLDDPTARQPETRP